MSYILDALRRSQAERDHGQVPGLHAQPTLTGAATTPAALPRWLWPAVAAAGVLLLAGLMVVLLRGEKPVAATATATRPATAATTAPVAKIETPAPLPTPPAPVVTAARPQPPPMVVSAPVTVAPPAAAAVPAARPVASAQSQAQAQAQAPAPAPASAAQPAPKSISLAQLSAEQRRELPNLAVGGSIWSESAANRFVIFNGQIVHEGESAAPGVVLERIAPKAAWLRWRDLRIEVPL